MSITIIIFHCLYHLCHCDPTMRAFVKNKVKCLAMMETVLNKKIETPILQEGCAVCSKQCDCGACPNEMFKTILILTIIFIGRVR